MKSLHSQGMPGMALFVIAGPNLPIQACSLERRTDFFTTTESHLKAGPPAIGSAPAGTATPLPETKVPAE